MNYNILGLVQIEIYDKPRKYNINRHLQDIIERKLNRRLKLIEKSGIFVK